MIWASAWISLCSTQAPVCAAPNGGVVVAGNARIDNGRPGITTITQGSNRAVINWGSFSIGAGEQAIFIQPNASSATLNRVLGNAASMLDGRLSANGHVFLINTNGIIFGKGSVVDAAGLVASTLDTSNASFMAGGDMVFQGKSQAAVTNLGQISASSGDVFLIGLQVNNAGSIRAPNGTVGLAAGSDVLIRAVGDERVVVRSAAGAKKDVGVDNSGIIEASVAELKAHNGNVYALAIRNTGRIAATAVTKQGGRILLRANGGAIENAGELVARGPDGAGGKVDVHAGNTGSVTLSGRVDADGTTGTGGAVTITGGQVTTTATSNITANGKTNGGQVTVGTAPAKTATPDAAATTTLIAGTIHANGDAGLGGAIRVGGNALTLAATSILTSDGATGGGSVLAGGGFRGVDTSITNAQNVVVERGAVLSANAIAQGSGGNVVLFANHDLTFNGNLQAHGGVNGGDGGKAELSGKGSLHLQGLAGHVDLGSTHGHAGALLIDPNDILITDLGSGTTVTNPAQANTLDITDVSTFLDTANLTIQTDSGASGGSGNITLDGLLSWTSSNSLTITALNNFTMTSSLATTGVISSLGGGDVTINAGRAITMEGSSLISTTTGNVVLNANQGVTQFAGDFNGITIGGSIETSGGNITMTGRTGLGSTTQTSGIFLDGGSLRADSGGLITLATTGGAVLGSGPITTDGLKLSGSSDFTLTGPGNSIGTVATSGTIGSLTLDNSIGLTVGTVGSATGIAATGNVALSTSGSDRLTIEQGVSSLGGAISLTAYGIDVNGATLSNTGSGTIQLTATRDMALNSGSTITVQNGNVQLDANQGGTPETGTFEGIRIAGASLTTSGSGEILLNGKGGDTGDNNNGIAMVLGATINATGTGGITLNGVAGGGDNGNRGVTLQNTGTAITSTSSAININGTGAGTGVDNFGVDVGADAAITSGGVSTILTDKISIDGAALISGSGTLTLKPLTTGTTIGLGDGAAGDFHLSTAGIAAITGLSSVTVGDNTMGAVDVQAVTWNAPVEISSGGTITVNGLLNGQGGSVTLSGAGADFNANVVTDGHAIIINSDMTLQGDVLLDTTNGGSVASGAGVTVTGAIQGNGSAPDFTINAGTGGAVALGGAVGSTGAIDTLDITGGSLVGTPTITSTTFNLTAGGTMDLTSVTATTFEIVGQSGNDTVMLSSVPTHLSVNGGGGTDTVTYASATGPITTGLDSYTNVETLIGSANSADVLIGASGNNTFVVTGANAGTANGINFSSFENLTGSNNGANGFTITNQGKIAGTIDGGGGTSATLNLNDSNLASATVYAITGSQITAGARTYQFQNITSLGLQLGSGNDTVNTNFFSFTQNLNGGNGDNRLLVNGTAVSTSPQTGGGGRITFTGFSVPAPPPVTTPPTVVPQDLTPVVGGSLLQNAVPTTGVFGGSTTPTSTPTTTNNFATTSTPSSTSPTSTPASTSPTSGSTSSTPATSTPPSGATGGGPSSLPSGDSVPTPATGVTSSTSAPGQGPVSMGGGAPASPATQTQMNATTSASAQSELNMTLGGDGTMGIVSTEGHVAVDPTSGPPSVTATSELNTGTSLLAQSELAIGTGGMGEFPVTHDTGAQSMTPGGAPPGEATLQGMESTTSAESFSDLSLALGGDGTTHTDNSTGSLAMSANGDPVPAGTEAELTTNTSPASLSELSSALGGSGEVVISPARPATSMDPAGLPIGAQLQSAVDTMLSAPSESELFITVGDDGTALMLDWDGNLASGLDNSPVSGLVKGKLSDATNQQSAEELDRALR